MKVKQKGNVFTRMGWFKENEETILICLCVVMAVSIVAMPIILH